MGSNSRAPSFHLPAKGTAASASVTNTPKVGMMPSTVPPWASSHQKNIRDVASQMGGILGSESDKLTNTGPPLSSPTFTMRTPMQPSLSIQAGAAVVGGALSSNSASDSGVTDPSSFASPGSVLFPASSRAEDAPFPKDTLTFVAEQAEGIPSRQAPHEGASPSTRSHTSSGLVGSPPVTVEDFGPIGVDSSPTLKNSDLVHLSPENMSEAGDEPEHDEGMSGYMRDGLGTFPEVDEEGKQDKIPSRNIADGHERDVSLDVNEHSEPDAALKGETMIWKLLSSLTCTSIGYSFSHSTESECLRSRSRCRGRTDKR